MTYHKQAPQLPGVLPEPVRAAMREHHALETELRLARLRLVEIERRLALAEHRVVAAVAMHGGAAAVNEHARSSSW